MIATTDPRLLGAVLANLADPNDEPLPGGPGEDAPGPASPAGPHVLTHTCEQCCKIKPASAFATLLQAKPGAPVICDACLDALPMDLVMALGKLNATPEPATPDPTHCQHLSNCAVSSCPACEPRWRGMAGLSMAGFLHDDPATFLTLFQALSERNKEETCAAIASFGGCTPAAVAAFIARSRARALACGVL